MVKVRSEQGLHMWELVVICFEILRCFMVGAVRFLMYMSFFVVIY